jgi:hypothetical protein
LESLRSPFFPSIPALQPPPSMHGAVGGYFIVWAVHHVGPRDQALRESCNSILLCSFPGSSLSHS